MYSVLTVWYSFVAKSSRIGHSKPLLCIMVCQTVRKKQQNVWARGNYRPSKTLVGKCVGKCEIETRHSGQAVISYCSPQSRIIMMATKTREWFMCWRFVLTLTLLLCYAFISDGGVRRIQLLIIGEELSEENGWRGGADECRVVRGVIELLKGNTVSSIEKDWS
jgi:hypothetical protein